MSGSVYVKRSASFKRSPSWTERPTGRQLKRRGVVFAQVRIGWGKEIRSAAEDGHGHKVNRQRASLGSLVTEFH